MPVTFRPTDGDEFARWLPTMRDRYAEDFVTNGGASEEQARRKALEDLQQVFPTDEPTDDQLVLVIEADGERVGELWLGERPTGFGRCLWIFDIHVDEDFRGRGYGKAAMMFAETEARRRSLNRIGLNVFAGNETARSLYRSLGYAENAIVMTKTV